MVKQLQISKAKAFTLIEMLSILLIISCLILTTLWSRSLLNIKTLNKEYEIEQLITKFNYFKSKAISNESSITLLFFNNTGRVQVVEEKSNKYRFNIKGGKVINIAKLNTINFDKYGNISNFGSLMKEHIYKIIFHIEKRANKICQNLNLRARFYRTYY